MAWKIVNFDVTLICVRFVKLLKALPTNAIKNDKHSHSNVLVIIIESATDKTF